jgi:hypothetical protein
MPTGWSSSGRTPGTSNLIFLFTFQSEVLGFEIRDDDGRTALQDVLGLGHDVAVGGKDVLDEIVVLAEKLAALVVVLDGEPRALDAVVGQDGIDQGQRRRLVVSLAEIVDDDVDRRWRGRRLRFAGGTRAMSDQPDEREKQERANGRKWNLQRVHMSKMENRTIQAQTSLTRVLRALPCGPDGERTLAHRALQALPILASKRASRRREQSYARLPTIPASCFLRRIVRMQCASASHDRMRP